MPLGFRIADLLETIVSGKGASAEWSITAKANNAVASVTRAGETGKSHYITYVGGSYSGNVTGGEMTLKQASSVLGDYFVHNSRGISLVFPLKIAQDAPVSLELAAGGLQVEGAVTLQGYSV